MQTFLRAGLLLLVSTGLASGAAAFEIVIANQNNLIQFTEQSFIQNVFGNQRSYAAARKHVQQALEVQLDFVESAVELTDQQRDKLLLAGRGDIQRFFYGLRTCQAGDEVRRHPARRVEQSLAEDSASFRALSSRAPRLEFVVPKGSSIGARTNSKPKSLPRCAERVRSRSIVTTFA